MSGLLSKFLPYLLLLYFLFRALKEPIFLLGIPFLMFFRYCIFFEQPKLFTIPARFGPDGVLLCWLILVWIILSSRSLVLPGYKRVDYGVNRRFNPMNPIVLGLIAVNVVDLFMVLNKYSNPTDVWQEFYMLVSLFLGYFIVKDIVRYVHPAALTDFLFSIVLVNTIASVLYIVHQGLHITIYDAQDTDPELVNGQLITRVFWFMPVLGYLSVAYLFVFRKRQPLLYIAMIVINLLGIFISYTRSLMTNAILIIILYFLFMAFKKRDIGSLVKNLMIIGISGLVLFFAISKFLPASTKFFMDRFKDLKQAPADEESNTLVYRFQATSRIIGRMDDSKRLNGMGPVTELQVPMVEDMRSTTSDMVWTGVIYRWGYMGLILMILLYLFGLIKSFTLFMRAKGIVSDLALMFLLILISQISESFTSWTFFNPGHFPLGLWYFGMLAGLLSFSRQADFSFENKDYVPQARFA